MKGRHVIVLENRAGGQMLEVIERRGGRASWLPVLAEVPDMDPLAIGQLLDAHAQRAFDLVVFQTGVGTRALFEAAARGGNAARLHALLGHAKVAARGPKPSAVLRAQKVRIDFAAAEPFTTEELLAAIPPDCIRGRRILVQRHGESNETLHQSLFMRGGEIEELPVYRWTRRDENVAALLVTLQRETVDAVVFTSMAQVHALFEGPTEEAEALRQVLAGVLICSIGPVCSAALRDAGVEVGLEPSPPKLGALFARMEEALT